MKAPFGAEAIGIGYEVRWRGIVMHTERPWVAQIVGTDKRFRYARRFLRPKADYRKANSKATRGVWHWWTLESGHLYEARYRTSWNGGFHHRFLTVDQAGEIIELSEEEAIAWLNVVSESTS